RRCPRLSYPTLFRSGPGTYVVGAEIKPGYYKTKGPDEDGICYWARLKDLSGGLNSIINNGIAEGPTTIQILRTDKAFETRGCQPDRKSTRLNSSHVK